MTAVELLFATVLVVAVPLSLRRVRFGDPAVDGWVRAVLPFGVPTSAALAVAMLVAPGPLALALATPWQVLSSVLAMSALLAVLRGRLGIGVARRLASATSLGFLAFGATNATSFAAGFGPLGLPPVIVLLTAVHFHAAGFVLMTAGIAVADRGSSVGAPRTAATGVGAVAIGSVVTAAGFVGVPGAAAVGAVIVAVGGASIAVATLRTRVAVGSAWGRRLMSIAGFALLVSMPLAIVWAVGPLVGIAPLDLDAMIRTHGALNALAVVLPLSVAWELVARAGPR